MDYKEFAAVDEFRHRLPVQLRFNDIDILGHLNNTVYLSLYDLAKARFLESVRGGVQDWQRVECVIANINCAYIEQVKFGEEIDILTRCIHVGEKSFTLDQLMVEHHTNRVKSHCETVMVCIDPDAGKSAPVSDTLRKALLTNH